MQQLSYHHSRHVRVSVLANSASLGARADCADETCAQNCLVNARRLSKL